VDALASAVVVLVAATVADGPAVALVVADTLGVLAAVDTWAVVAAAIWAAADTAVVVTGNLRCNSEGNARDELRLVPFFVCHNPVKLQ